jgi:hypothetical protein
MATTTVVSGNSVKSNTGTVAGAGTQPSTSTISELDIGDMNKGATTLNKVKLATSTASSGNLGTAKVISAGTFQSYTANNYIYPVLCETIAGQSNTAHATPASNQVNRPIAFTESDRRINITSWNAVTGAATYGGNRGDSVSFGTDDAARPTAAVPGELVILIGGATPSQLNYPAR